MKLIKYLLITSISLLFSCSNQSELKLENNDKTKIESSKSKNNYNTLGMITLNITSYKINKEELKSGVTYPASLITDYVGNDLFEFKFGKLYGPVLISKKTTTDTSYMEYRDLYFMPRTQTSFDPKNPKDLTNELKDKKTFKVLKIGTFTHINSYGNDVYLYNLKDQLDLKINSVKNLNDNSVKFYPELIKSIHDDGTKPIEELSITLNDILNFKDINTKK
ncbi:MAG: hypothetical protein U0457_07170 [Candidatus Sericytochromatia bacterium]